MRNSKTEGSRLETLQSIKALEDWFVSGTDENCVRTQDVDEVVVVLQRIKLTSRLIRIQDDRSIPCWSRRRRQVELGESTGRQCEIHKQSVADDDHGHGLRISRS